MGSHLDELDEDEQELSQTARDQTTDLDLDGYLRQLQVERNNEQENVGCTKDLSIPRCAFELITNETLDYMLLFQVLS